MIERIAPTARGSEKLLVWLAFAVIYIVWGSTYIAIRFAIETIPPLLVAGSRHLMAGSLLLAWALSKGYRPTWREWRASAVVGVLFFLIGHGTLHWAERFVPSGLAALLIATEPMFITVLAFFYVREERSTTLTWVGLLVGLGGIALLTTDNAISGSRMALIGAAAILLGGLSWSFGIMYSKRASMPRDAVAKSALPLLVGAASLLVAAVLSGEASAFHVGNVSARSVGGLAYLVLFGTVLAFTSYTWLLQRCKASVVATHTYVNPVVAVILGWALGGEQMSARVIVSAVLVVLSVVLISKDTGRRSEKPERAPEPEEEAA